MDETRMGDPCSAYNAKAQTSTCKMSCVILYLNFKPPVVGSGLANYLGKNSEIICLGTERLLHA